MSNTITTAAENANDAVGLMVMIKTILATTAIWGAISTAFVVVWRSRIPMRKIKVDADQRMRENLLERVAKLEQANDVIRADYEARIDKITIESQAREAVLRHELQNTRSCFNALLLLLRRMPDRPGSLDAIISDIDAMRKEQIRGEDLERNALTSIKGSTTSIDNLT